MKFGASGATICRDVSQKSILSAMYFDIQQAALEECQMLRDAVDILERESKALVSRNRTLTEEIQRLTIVIGAASPGQVKHS